MKPNSAPRSTHRFPINLRHLALVLIALAGVAWWCQRGPAPSGTDEPVGVTSRQVVDGPSGSSGPDGSGAAPSSRPRRQAAAGAATGSAVAALADGFRRAGGGSVAPEVLAGLRGSKRGDAVEVRLPGLRLSGGVDSVLDGGGVWHVGIEVADGRGRMVVSGRDDGLLTATVNLYGEEPGLKLANTLADPQVRIEELPYCRMVCAEPGTRYPAKP
ncbi:MAG: hypothetical protein NTW21_13150, partial [Verrucomicrobia bacterium]|nr:hypothetical protein [Verrucomicrobiota bacterium]